MTKSRNILSMHGKRNTSEYETWYAMRRRCNNKNNMDYRHYGGRGIKVCERWNGSHNFLAFFEDMGLKPSSKHTIDRIDNDGDYTPENCRWSTQEQQTKNQRIRKDSTTLIPGVNKRTDGWKVQIQNNKKRHYLGLVNDFFEACCMRKSAENKLWRII